MITLAILLFLVVPIATGMLIAAADPPRPTRCPNCGYVEISWRCHLCKTDKVKLPSAKVPA